MSATIQAITRLILCCAAIASCQRPGGAQPQTVSPQESDGALQSLWSGVLRATPDDKPTRMKREWKMLLTTWLPGEWPPTPKTIWTRYAYGLDISMDGSSDVSAPFARIERHAGDHSREVITPMTTKLKVIAIHPVRPHGGWHYTLDDEKRILTAALSLTAAPPPDASGAPGLVSYFQSWRLGNAEIASYVEPKHRAFFTWLKSAP